MPKSKTLLLTLITAFAATISGCVAPEQSAPCPQKSDTEIIANTISDILVPKARWGC